MKKLILVLLALLVAGECFGVELGTGLENENYKRLKVLVEGLPEDAKKIGLTESAIQTKTELRLRMAGIMPVEKASKWLYISIAVIGNAYGVSIDFMRPIYYIHNNKDLKKHVTSWDTNHLGTHRGDTSYILGTLDIALDIFLNEYLKTNMPK